MYIGLAALGFTFFLVFGEKINKMDFNFTRAELSLLVFLWVLAVLGNKHHFHRLWKKFRKAGNKENRANRRFTRGDSKSFVSEC